MAALGRLDDLEKFLLGSSRRTRSGRAPSGSSPAGCTTTRCRRRSPIGSASPEELGAALAASEIELVVFATDVSDYPEGDEARDFELEYSSRTTEPEVMGRAILASAAISGLVLPIPLDGLIATDGGWVRNFPFEHAYRNPDVAAIAAFRYVASYPPTDVAFLERTRERLERFRAVPPVRALLAEVRLAQERSSRGEPAHYGELIVRLMRVAFARNTVVEERIARERETSVAELRRLREDVIERGRRGGAALAPPTPSRGARGALRGGALSVPPRPARPGADRPRDRGRRRPRPDLPGDIPWPTERKRALIERGYTLTDEALARSELGELNHEAARSSGRRALVAAAKRTPSGICAFAIPTRRWRSAPEEGRQGSGQAVGPLPMRGEQAPAHRGLLAASPGGKRAAARA